MSAVLFLSKKIWSPVEEKSRVLEIGCGSGNLAIALASREFSWDILAVDIDKKALSLARKNASELGFSNIQFLLSNKFSKVTGKLDIIISNPPYVSSSEYDLLDELARKQPKKALLSADSGYFFYEAIIKRASSFLKKKFLVAFEIGHSQKERIIKIILKYFPHIRVEVFRDFGGNPRVVTFYQR